MYVASVSSCLFLYLSSKSAERQERSASTGFNVESDRVDM